MFPKRCFLLIPATGGGKEAVVNPVTIKMELMIYRTIVSHRCGTVSVFSMRAVQCTDYLFTYYICIFVISNVLLC